MLNSFVDLVLIFCVREVPLELGGHALATRAPKIDLGGILLAILVPFGLLGRPYGGATAPRMVFFGGWICTTNTICCCCLFAPRPTKSSSAKAFKRIFECLNDSCIPRCSQNMITSNKR